MRSHGFTLACLAGVVVVVLLCGVTIATHLQSDPVLIESKSTVFRLGGSIPLRLSTREKALSESIGGANLFVKCADGRERKLSSSAQSGKVRIEQGAYVVDVDAGQLAEAGVPGNFEVVYQLEDGHRGKAFHGKLLKPIERPSDLLDKDAKKAEFGTVAVLFETDEGNMLIGLRGDKAPKTVRNFATLAAAGFYNNLVFHRVKRGMLLQGGGVRKDGTKTNAERVKGEFSNFSHERGVVSMARLPEDKDSATSQFFICLVNLGHSLDGKFASFGQVIDGQDVMDRMSQTPVVFNPELDEKSKPENPPLILSATCVERL